MVLQDALYLHSMPKREKEDLLLFIAPKEHQTTTLNGCHQNAGHQGNHCTLSLLQECFWWPRMAKQIRLTIRACTHCLQNEGDSPKSPFCPIVATAPLDLLHVDFTSIETHWSQTNYLESLTSWFSKTTSWNTCWCTWPLIKLKKIVAKFLYGGYISILRAPARLLGNRGASFMSNIIEELCKILGTKQLQTMPYHPQTNGLVERSHQMIMHMIRKLRQDKKVDWSSHLTKIVHAYNATWSAVTGYSPHYLMFGYRPRLPVDFVFPTIGSNEAPMREASAKHVDVYIASVWDRLRTTIQEAWVQLMAEACQQKWYYDRKIGAVNLKPGNLILVKADAFKGKRKIKDRWEEETWEVVCQIATDIPSYEVTNQHGRSRVLHQNWFLLVVSEVCILLCMGSHHAWDRCTSPTPCRTTSVRGERKRMPQENNGKAVTWWPTSKVSWGWKNGKLWLLPWTLTRTPTEDGWRPQVM